MDTQLQTDLLDQGPDAVIFAGTDGLVAYWNAAAERIFGHTSAAAMGQSLDIIIPEQYREAHWTAYDRALADGDTKYRGQSLATRSVRADGEKIYVELSFGIIKDAAGASIGAIATARDITERFTADREMRRKLRELEKAAAN
ncbi:MAG: PAS domain S-box protein [Tepidiformaceae bacterium]